MLQNERYTPPSEEALQRMMRERITRLKQFKSLANNILEQNKLYKNSIKKPTWQNSTIEHNIQGLQSLIQEINSLRKDEKKLREYCLGISGDVNYCGEAIGQHNDLSFLSEVSNYSIPGGIVHDLNWLTMLTVGEKIEISLGDSGPEILGKYWSMQCKIVKEKAKKNLNSDSLQKNLVLLEEAISIAHQGFYLSSNIVLFVLCESLVRYLATKLFFFQNPGTSPEGAEEFVSARRSLENILLFDGWKNDLEYPIVRIAVEFGYVAEPEVKAVIKALQTARMANKAVSEMSLELLNVLAKEKDNENSNTISEGGRNTLDSIFDRMKASGEGLINKNERRAINVRVKLHFLIRRFKEDRNAMIHGQIEDFNHKWKNVIYLAALEKILETIGEYKKIYSFD
jgi:hypothetical protein